MYLISKIHKLHRRQRTLLASKDEMSRCHLLSLDSMACGSKSDVIGRNLVLIGL